MHLLEHVARLAVRRPRLHFHLLLLFLALCFNINSSSLIYASDETNDKIVVRIVSKSNQK